ncbi:MAG: 4Fe-4S binding protein [Candidatus Cloacimonadota bacterium]|nr:4Fe-4S binding protein [Candidatus Cloacimonadota bacterium]
MQYIISSECVSCGICKDICPISAIYIAETQYMISKACVGCGKCTDACPVDAAKERGE